MKTISHIQVKSRGRITFPKQFRDAHNIEDGDIILLAEAGDGVIIMQHKKSNTDRIADKIAREFQKEGVTLKGTLKELKKIRK